MHLVHTYIAYRVSNICSVYRSGLLMCRIGTVTCVCVTHTNPLTRYPVEGVCTLTTDMMLNDFKGFLGAANRSGAVPEGVSPTCRKPLTKIPT